MDQETFDKAFEYVRQEGCSTCMFLLCMIRMQREASDKCMECFRRLPVYVEAARILGD